MKNEEILKRKKAALRKLLDNRQYFYSGLCHLINGLCTLNILTSDEYIILDKLLDSYFDENEEVREAFIRYRGFMWEPGEWEPREKWILSNLESIDLLLNSIKQSK